MLKHQEIIDKLTIEQKIDLIANAASLGQSELCKEYQFLKLKSLKKEENWHGFPSFNALAKSWNTNLISKVTSKVLKEQKQLGVNLVELPVASVKVSPYSSGISEDPYLSGKLVSAVANAGEEVGMAVLADSPLLSSEDVSYSDIEPNTRAIQEYFYPSHRILAKSNLMAMKMPSKKLGGKYGEINQSVYDKMAKKYLLVCDEAESDAVRETAEDRKIFLRANKDALIEAYEKYQSLMKSFDLCEIGLSDVHKACEKGVALSPEKIDETVDVILNFTDLCNEVEAKPNNAFTETKKRKKKKEERSVEYVAVEESSVLLKNAYKTLPLSRGTKISLIGALADGENGLKENFESLKQSKKVKFVGFEKGYGNIKDRNDELIDSACRLASKSDVAVVVLGFNEEDANSNRLNRNSKIPANQEALIEKLSKTGAKIVVLLVGESSFDMSFDKYANSVLLVPTIREYSAKAIINMLYGLVSPSGKLINSLYENTDKKFKEIKNYKDAKRNQIGVFYGYRNYDTGDYAVKYPFGFGLSYTNFKYSKLKISKGKLSFVIKNVGKRAGSEAVQIYAGHLKSNVMRAKKELKCFYKIALNPGQSKKLTFNLQDFDFKIYDKDKKAFFVESGYYGIYVCSSAIKVELQGKAFVGGVNFEKDGFKKSDYFQKLSNIKDGQFYLEEPIKMPKYTEEGRLRGAVIASFAVVFLDTIYFYLYSMKWLPGGLIYFIIIIAITLIPIITALTLRSRKKVLERKYILKSKKMKKDKFSKIDPEDINEEIPYEQLFVEEFEEPEIEVEDELSSVEDVKASENFIQYTFNPELTAKRIVDEFTLYLKERNVLIDVESVRSLFSAMSSSRMLFINYENKDVEIDFIKLLSKYFNCDLVVEDFDNLHALGDDIITASESGVTSVASALINGAEENANKMRIMSVNNVVASSVKDCVSQIFRYLDQPTATTSFFIRNGESEGHHEMPKNVWFTFILKEGEKISDLPRYVLESSCVVNLVLRDAEEKKEAPKKKGRKKAEKELELVLAPEVEEPIVVATEPAPVAEENAEATITAEIAENKEETTTSETADNQENAEAQASEESAVIAENVEAVTEQASEESIIAPVESAVEPVLEQQAEEVVQAEVEQEVIEVDDEADKTPVELVEFYQFEKLIENARRNFELSENLWKRLDKLEEYIQSLDSNYKINNKLWLRLEKYVSMYLSVGGVEEEALDSVVAHYVINTMIPSVLGSKAKNEKFTVTLENIFGEGHVPHSIKAVKATGLKI